MKVHSSVLYLLALAAVGAIWFTRPSGDGTAWDSALASENFHSAEIELVNSQRTAFAAFQDDLVEDLLHARANLPQATHKMLSYVRSFYPIFLAHLEAMEEGLTDEERVARNLMRH